MHKLPHLFKSRHGVWYIRYQREGHEVKRSLQTKDWSIARLLGLQFNLSWAMTFRKFDVVFPGGIRVENINTESDHDRFLRLMQEESFQLLLKATQRTPQPPVGGVPERLSLTSVAVAGAVKQHSKNLTEVISLFLDEKNIDNTQKTVDEKKSVYEQFSTFFGDMDINQYNSEHALSFKTRLIGRNLSGRTINKRTSALKCLFEYAIDHRLYFNANPFQNVSISTKAKLRTKVKSYEQFTDDELKLIFSESTYKPYMNKPDYYWLPFLALHSGARIEELASLEIRQIKEEAGVLFFDIESGKNENSVRRIPLHKNCATSGFMAYLEKVKTNSTGKLFPHLKDGKNGFSKNCSRRFGLYLDMLGIKDSRKVFHSFRSTFINRMTETNVHPAILMGIVGHFDQAKVDFSSPHFQTYQQKKPIKVMKDAIDKLEFDLKFFF